MLIPIDAITENPANARRIDAPQHADDALAASIRTIGLLQPILVRPNGEPGRYEVLAGHRRLKAMRTLGWTEVPAVLPSSDTDQPITAISAAENMVRAAMHPVDQWRAMADLRASSGHNLETAAAALGVSLHLARRMEHLGKMIPEILDRMGESDLPDGRTLRNIAMAPHDVQRDALREAGDLRPPILWTRVASGCQCQRIPITRAIFDTTLLDWDEDLFAEPSDPERFTTTEIAKFLFHQREVLLERVERSKGRVEIVPYDARAKPYPSGWQPIYGEIPKRWRKDDERRAFAMLVEDGFHAGTVIWQLAEPKPKRQSHKGTDGAPPTPRPPISKAALTRLATLKGEAVRDRLTHIAPAVGAKTMLHALLLACSYNNMSTATFDPSVLVDPDGYPKSVDTDYLCALAADVIGQKTVFRRPDFFSDSGPAAEWLATLIEADMPRTDTEEILRGIDGDTLYQIAEQFGVSTRGTLGQLRKRLENVLPNWRAVQFGAPGPVPYESETPVEVAPPLDDDPDFSEVEVADPPVAAVEADEPAAPEIDEDEDLEAWSPG